MVTKLKDNFSYIKYIRNKIMESFPEWKEYGEAVYEDQINNNFEIIYLSNIRGYSDSKYKISFIKDRGLLLLRIYDKNNAAIDLGYILYNSVIINIPDQNKKWPLELNIELIDYYINFLKLYFTKI